MDGLVWYFSYNYEKVLINYEYFPITATSRNFPTSALILHVCMLLYWPARLID